MNIPAQPELSLREAVPTEFQLDIDEPDAVLRALNNAYLVIEDSCNEKDAVANCVLHEILRARSLARPPQQGADKPAFWSRPGGWLAYDSETVARWARSDDENEREVAKAFTVPFYARSAEPASEPAPAEPKSWSTPGDPVRDALRTFADYAKAQARQALADAALPAAQPPQAEPLSELREAARRIMLTIENQSYPREDLDLEDVWAVAKYVAQPPAPEALTELTRVRKSLVERDKEILRLRRELHLAQQRSADYCAEVLKQRGEA